MCVLVQGALNKFHVLDMTLVPISGERLGKEAKPSLHTQMGVKPGGSACAVSLQQNQG